MQPVTANVFIGSKVVQRIRQNGYVGGLGRAMSSGSNVFYVLTPSRKIADACCRWLGIAVREHRVLAIPRFKARQRLTIPSVSQLRENIPNMKALRLQITCLSSAFQGGRAIDNGIPGHTRMPRCRGGEYRPGEKTR